jgi:hypothetical protein
MKKILILLSFLCFSLYGWAQQMPDFESIKLETKEDYNETANSAALAATTYILSHAPNKEDKTLFDAGRYLVTWMLGTPEYTFSMDDIFNKLYDANVLTVFMASMAEYCMKNKADKDDVEKVTFNTVKRLITYIEENKIKVGKNIKRAIDADKKGNLSVYLSELKNER